MPYVTELVSRPHVLVTAIGILLLIAGARFYRFAIVAPGFVAGVFLAQNYIAPHLPSSVEQMIPEPYTDWGVAIVLGGVFAMILNSLEEWAVRITGAVLAGGLAHTLIPDPWIPLGAALVGAFAFPTIYKKLLPITTSLLGAVCITWSLEEVKGPPESVYMVSGLSLAGIIAQLFLFKDSSRRENQSG